jgi:hypothetical protein
MTASSITDWITAIGTGATALSIGIVLLQVFLLKKQIHDDHERSRREKAVDLMLGWSRQLDRKSSITRKFAELLSEENLRCIFNQESFSLPGMPEKNEKLLAACLGLEDEKAKLQTVNGQIVVSESQSGMIRWQLISYLNSLESVISAWACNVADREIIQNEFEYLFSSDGSGQALAKFRVIAGGSASYPYIELFEIEMKKLHAKRLEARVKLG